MAEWLSWIDVDMQVLVVGTKEVQVEILDGWLEVVDLSMSAMKLMDLLVESSYKVPTGAY